MLRRLSRLWPEGFAGRLALLLLAGLGAFGVVAGLLYLDERRDRAAEHFARTLTTRLVAMVELLERVEPGERPLLLRALSGRSLRVRLHKGDLARQRGWRPRGAFHEEAARHLARLSPRPVLVRAGGAGPDGLSRRNRPLILVAVRLQTAEPLWAEFGVRPPRWPWRAGALVWLGLTALLVVLALVWGAHRMTRPLRRFAEAADRLGLDNAPPPVPERGPRELRRAASAFNRMTARIRRLIDDRTLMLAAVTHDLRTMLTRLRLRAEFIEDPEQQGKAAADLDEMQAMLAATLAFARDEAADEGPQRLDLAALLQSLAADLADAGRAVSYEGPDRLALLGRPLALRRVFENLVDNALGYGGEARLTLGRAEGRAEVCIDDRGPGIPPALRERVFDPFFRVEPSRNRETGGAGLGLAVVRAILQRHGGAIHLEDRSGGGLRARVLLPLEA